MTDCIFCRIVAGEIPARIAHQDEHVVAFHDLNPQAPIHVLLVPRRHIPTLLDASPEDSHLLGVMEQAAVLLARKLGLAESGFRLVANCGPGAGQSVFHIHLHLLGGRRMNWPPG